MCTNGTQIPCEGCHPYPIPQHVKVGHTTGVHNLFSFWIVMWVLFRPTRANQWKCCETGPTVFCPYPRRLESLIICRCHYKGSSFFSVISRPRVLAQPWFEPLKLPLSRLALSSLLLDWLACNFLPYDTVILLPKLKRRKLLSFRSPLSLLFIFLSFSSKQGEYPATLSSGFFP